MNIIYGPSIIMGDLRMEITLLIMPMLFYIAVFFKPITRILEFPVLNYLGNLSMIVFFIHVPILLIYKNIINHIHYANYKIEFLVYILLVFTTSILISQLYQKKHNNCKINCP